MGLSEDGCDVDDRFEALCFDLNMDTQAKDEAWTTYQRIKKNYTLEGDQIYWLVCALYESCRRSVVPTVDRGTIEGNCVSLTRLLRSAQLSLIQFFDKMRKWSDMASLPQEFRDKIDRLERNFAVSTVIFKKFAPIFIDIFKNPSDDVTRTPRGRKQKRQPCTATEIFNFCWTMFVQVKGNFPAISDDLVNSYHLLLCCIDWVYANVILCERDDLINPTFSAGTDNESPTEPPCIISSLCTKHEGLELEAMGIKEHWWKLHIKKLFDKKILRGKAETLSGVLDLGNFETNQKTINNAYDEYVLTVGDFDERIFLGDLADEEIGTPAKSSSFVNKTGEFRERLTDKTNLQRHFDQTQTLAPSTPLTGRLYLSEKEASITPVSTATQSVARLQAMLSGRSTCPSDALTDIFLTCNRDPSDCVTSRVKAMGHTFCTGYAQPSGDDPGFHVDFAKKRLQLGESLYYKVLENVLMSETRMNKNKEPKPDLTALLEQDVFHTSLFALCLEVVIFSYNSQRTFPWIVETFDLSYYQFYKVIEILIRAEDGLSRDVVKHLNHIEERIIESLAWKGESALWDALKDQQGNVPPCEEVMLPPELAQAPAPPVIRRILTTTDHLRPILPKDSLLSPNRFLASERFISPKPGITKRRLFTDETRTVSAPGPSFATPGSTISLLKSPTMVNNSPRQLVAVQSGSGDDGTAKNVLINVNTRSVGGKVTSPTIRNIAIAPKVVALSPRQIITSKSGSPISTRTLSPVVIQKSGSIQKVADKKLFTVVHGGETVVKIEPSTSATQVSATKPKRVGSLGLFFRKVYHLASVRLRELCDNLGTPIATQQKIWTCFEYCLMKHSDLMRDRHLDQLLMCAIYVMTKIWTWFEYCLMKHSDLMRDRHLDQLLMCAIYVMTKVLSESVSFQEIMKNYRLQPQAQSHIYRSVLITDKRRHTSGSSEGSKANSRSASPLDDPRDTRKRRRPVSKKEAGGRLKRRAEMSLIRSTSTLPVPHPTSQPPTPTKMFGGPSGTFDFGEERGDIIVFYNTVYVKRMQTFVNKFSSKTGQDLHAINDMIRMGDRISIKHSLPLDTDGASPAKKVAYQSPLEKKLQRLTAERREANGEM